MRDEHTKQLIEEARAQGGVREADAVSDALEGPFDDKPVPTAKDHECTVLRGESHDAFVEFTAAAQALEAHQRAAAPVLERYKSALGKLSAIAARSAREHGILTAHQYVVKLD